MYQVLALDLDGTVLNDDHEIHVDVVNAIREVALTHHVILVTGRHHTAAKPYYDQLKLDTPIICCNGTYVYDYKHNRVLAQNALDKESAKAFLDLARHYDMKLVLYVTNSMLYSKTQPIEYMKSLEKWSKSFDASNRPDIRQIESFSKEIDNARYIWKFVIEGEPTLVEKLQRLPFVQEYFSGERSWSNRVDFSSKGNSKGARLKEYLQQNNYIAEQVVAIGDNHNDISMIQLAGLGVAMNNADQTVKQAADMVCPSNNNQGGLSHLIREKFRGIKND